MKNTKKLISVLLVAMLLITSVVVTGITASAAGTLASYYKTNPDNQFGVEKTITVDGDISDWTSAMLVAQGAANDDPRVYRPNSMYEVAEDLYALYAAYDNSNLYLMWEMTNVQDMVAPNDDYPLSQGTLYETMEFPLFIFIDTGKTADAIGNQGKTTTGGTLWDKNITLEKSFNRVIATNVKGNNGPWIYGGTSAGINPVEMYNASTSGVQVKYGKGIISKNVYGIDKAYGVYNKRVPGDVCDDSAAWVDFNAKGHNSSKYDFHYEVSIPLDRLGITKSDITSNGIGAMLVLTSGLSGMDCLPYDVSMNDNADLDDGAHSQENNSFEKSDEDYITASFARIGAQGDSPVIPTDPTVPTQPTDPTTPTDPVGDTATVNVTSNYFGSSSVSNLKVGDTFTATYELNANMGVASADWNLSYDRSALKLKTAADALCPSGGTVNAGGNPVYGNFTNVQNPYSFSGGKTFVQAEFEVLKAGTYNVALTVEELNFAYKSGNTLYLGSAVENSQVQDITGQQGFGSLSTSAVSKAESGSNIEETLTVNAKSNFFKTASATFDADTNQVTVAYRLQSNMGVVNTQWSLRYDASKLRYSSASMPKASGATIRTPDSGVVTGNFTTLDMISYSAMDDFAVITFDVIGTGETDVTLTMMNLGIGYKSGGQVNEAYLVDDTVIKNLNNTTGFTNLSYSTESLVYSDDVLLGDIDGSGRVTVNDATQLQRYLAEYITLTSKQLRAADVNGDGRINVDDVTAIQRMLAN